MAISNPFRGMPRRVSALLLGMLLSAGLCAYLLARGLVHPEMVVQVARSGGPYHLIIYVVLVIVLELLWMPRVWGLLAGGLLFGPWLGMALSLVADTLSALICFGIARSTARAWIEGLLAARPKAAFVVQMLSERRGAVMIGLLRVCPIAHYTLVNYAAGAAGVRPIAFLLGTVIGLLPGAALYSFVGNSLLEPGSPVFWIALAIAAIAMVLTYVMTKRWIKRAGPAPGIVGAGR